MGRSWGEPTTVAQLIEKLKEYPPETEVLGWDGADYCPERGPAVIGEVYVYEAGGESFVDRSKIVIENGD